MKNKKGFTLIELVLALLIAGIFVGIIMSLYTGIKSADMRMSEKRLLLGEATDLIDKIHDAALNYTIDYEEYFNRRGFQHPNGFTTYGNEGYWYYCRSGGNNYCQNNNAVVQPYRHCKWDNNLGGCLQNNQRQKYLEYQFQHRKLNDPLNLNSKDNSGSNMRMGPVAIDPNTGLDYLYLINPDGTERYYFRRVSKTGMDLNHDGQISGKNEELYKVQMLRLRGFDIGSGHDCNSWGAYDGFIDTRACDSLQGFSCNGQNIMSPCDESNGLGYRLPSTGDDGRIDITSDNVTVSDLKIDIYPNKDPYLVGNETGLVYDPYAKISFTLNIFGKAVDDEITMTTTLSFKNSYTRFAAIQYTGYIPDEAY